MVVTQLRSITLLVVIQYTIAVLAVIQITSITALVVFLYQNAEARINASCMTTNTMTDLRCVTTKTVIDVSCMIAQNKMTTNIQ